MSGTPAAGGGAANASSGPLDRAAADLHPAYFALVMATGIVSLAASIQGYAALARAMLWLNIAFFAALWVLTILRVARHRARLLADLADHNRSVGFFTMVPAACVLGTQTLLIGQWPAAAWGLWVFGAAVWALLTYGIFTILIVKPSKPALADGLSGGWLVSVVATQAVAVLAAQLAGHVGAASGHAETLLLVALVMWLGGAMLYIWIIALIFYRYMFFPFKPSDLAPPYWINMGAMAISTLAGASLILAGEKSPLIAGLLPFVKGATLLFWATATWWIPMLLILGVWRHLIKKFPLRYDPLYWGAVFPLGMYSVATARMNAAMDLPILGHIPGAAFYAAMGAWSLAIIGLAHRLVASRPPAIPAARP
ncbi:MAG: tellurite resistance/C4-dicarboxylate transporter family protein [Phycisphaerales bacterium]|nr:tellurite resistance/C4-dicarboxylate transporter family protein [Phycisphaerales bacterium]